MSDFKRSPSKVWWGNGSVEWREVTSSSPGSQDSGFSDSETSSSVQVVKANNSGNETPKTNGQKVPKDIFKGTTSEKPQNLSANYKEKTTPDKSIKLNEQIRLTQSDLKGNKHSNDMGIKAIMSEANVRHSKYIKHSPKVSRNLFNIMRQKESMKDVIAVHQYSKGAETTSSNSEMTYSDCYSLSEDSSENLKTTSLTIPEKTTNSISIILNKSAPAVLDNFTEEITSVNNSLSSDCESELECLFNGPESPKHTSTPMNKMRHRKNKLPLHLHIKYQLDRVTPIKTENNAVKKWMDETRQFYEQECMTTLQCKSIAGELSQKVSHLASYTTANIRNVLTQSQCIEREYKHLNSEKRYVEPLIQSLAGNIIHFIKTYTGEISPELHQHYDNIRKANSDESFKLVSQLFNTWQLIQQEILSQQAKLLVDKLENPCSELDLRATTIGVTSLALRNENLIQIFTNIDIIPILLILTEKCEGSSMRGLLLRALTTMCCNTKTVRQFEKYSGIQLVADTLKDESRPEPERSEAAALLAQVTAPWIEDNHTIKGLQEYSKKIVKALTRFLSTTKCCQNLLLCTAALTNLSTMDQKSIKYMLHQNTVQILLNSVNKRLQTSVYFLEQIATLIANMSAVEVARKQLTKIDAAAALLYFLKIGNCGMAGDVDKRLQQKSIIALSRLCGEFDAANQVVELGGVEKLVKMCREKNERFNSDAVLVATLATLRKIADTCGNDVMSIEDSQELVQPKLLDSFLAYSTQSESYV